jgi:homoserine kinase
MSPVRARAHASIANLGHGFDVFAACVTAGFDEVELSLARRGSIEIEGHEADGIPRDPKRNTAGLALHHLMRHLGIRRAVRMRIRKGAPAGGGLGSSAASSVAAVFAADRLFGSGLSRTDLIAYAAQGEIAAARAAHADNVAASMVGGLVIVDPRDPTRVQRITSPRGLRFVIAMPRVRITTAEARKALPRRVALSDYSLGAARFGMMIAALEQDDVATFGRMVQGAFTDRARARLVPAFADVGIAAREAGAAGVALSGAGPSSVAVVDAELVDPRPAAATMTAAFARAGLEARAWVARVAGGARIVGART